MPKIRISDVPGLDGEYDLDLNFTHRDFRTIKQVAGVRAMEVMGAIEAGDLDVVVALTEIALTKAGKQHSLDDLWDAPAGSLILDFDDQEVAEDGPPPSGLEPRSDDASESSGAAMSNGTDTSPEMSTPLSSGTPQLVSTSDRLTSTT